MTINSEFNREISFDIVERIGVIASYSTGWSKELNLVSWNGAAPKYDIRDWAPDHSHMSRGVTLHEKEMRIIFDLLRSRGRKQPYDRREATDASRMDGDGAKMMEQNGASELAEQVGEAETA